MYQYTHKNHFQFGYNDDRWFCNRESKEDKFVARFGRCTQTIDSWREANIDACLKIRENFEGDLWVLFSGGVDSEICIRSFHEAKIPIRIASLKFSDGLNSHDIFYVNKLAEEMNLDIKFFDLDVLKFFESEEILKIVEPINCVSPILACHLWLADQIVGVPIFAQGEVYLRKEVENNYLPGKSIYPKSNWHLIESERLCSLYKHFIFKNKPAVPGFYQYTPEQFFAYLCYNPILRELVSDNIIGKLGTRTSKNLMAYQFYPELERREKFTGFERITHDHDKLRFELAKRYPESDTEYLIGYRELIKILEPRGKN